jgi:hypothetical protein
LLVAVTARDDDANGLSLIDDFRILFHYASLVSQPKAEKVPIQR